MSCTNSGGGSLSVRRHAMQALASYVLRSPMRCRSKQIEVLLLLLEGSFGQSQRVSRLLSRRVSYRPKPARVSCANGMVTPMRSSQQTMVLSGRARRFAASQQLHVPSPEPNGTASASLASLRARKVRYDREKSNSLCHLYPQILG